MAALWDKLDAALGSKYADYLRGGADTQLLVSLYYEGALADIEAAGFRTAFRGSEGYATGDVLLSGLAELAAQPGVVRISFGQDADPLLDRSVPQINARPDVWEWDAAASQFVGATGKGTGKGVLIGIIDSGIDWRHPFFLNDTAPLRTSRIRAIWDTGLRPDGDEGSGPPDPSLLTGEAGPGVSYGVEYNNARIQAAVLGAQSIRHRDCTGHGTHVASIAAGNGGPSRRLSGVAPEAELIVVKYLYPQNERRKNNDPSNSLIGPNIAFQDAVHYILKKAEALNRPVVINASLGRALGPHDGYTSTEDWLTKTFDARPRACYVCSAGNDAGTRQHGLLEFPGADSVDLDIELTDDLRNRKSYSFCEMRSSVPDSLVVQIYYPPAAGPITVTFDPKDGLAPRNGPVRGGGAVLAPFEGFEAVMTHVMETQGRTYTGAGPLQRSRFQLELKAKKDAAGGNPIYREETYTLRITAPAALTAHVWVQQMSRKLGLRVVPRPPVLTAPDEFLIGTSHGAANTLTVASYDAEEPATLPISPTSSRGPLVNYEGPGPHPVQKPDIAAPGMKITAAASREIHPRSKDRKNAEGSTRKDGTSMAAPHVAGVVALMLENNPSLTSTQVVAILRDHGRIAVPAGERNLFGQGRVDAKLAFDKALTP